MSKTIRHRKEKRINAISVRSNVILLIVLTLLAALCVLPVLLVVIVSFSSEQSIFLKGYSFFPAEFSLEAYKFFLRLGDQIVRSYAITLFVTVFGTLFSLAVTTMLAYVLSRPDYRYGRILTLLLLFTMLFNGGLVPSYMVNTQLLGLRDTVWALIFPMSLNVFYVVVLRTFFKGIPLDHRGGTYGRGRRVLHVPEDCAPSVQTGSCNHRTVHRHRLLERLVSGNALHL